MTGIGMRTTFAATLGALVLAGCASDPTESAAGGPAYCTSTDSGDDLSTDYRSWVMAHGQAAYDAVLADPDALRELADAADGCGLGAPFGAVAADLYLERTGLGFRKSGLPLLEVPARD